MGETRKTRHARARTARAERAQEAREARAARAPHEPRPPSVDARRKAIVATVLAVALCLGSWLIRHGAGVQGPPPQPSAAQAFAPYRPGAPVPRMGPSVPPLPPSPPTRVRIPDIQVDAPTWPLPLLADGSLAGPPDDDRDLAGWYAGGTTPGAPGTAIVAGHVDTAAGPAAFYSLGALKKGQAVEIARADGRTAVFTIDAIEVYGNDDFPSEKVYGPSARAELRLITCGGGFDTDAHAYLGNVVVYAHLTSVREPFPRARPAGPAPLAPMRSVLR
ncbi:class F sortase [Streptomyces sp. NPDC051173]|uniref:class F sortase n=1 Tax=Streptomyces sp. NPDC051173 TaxID=3155164 RepID=UPI00344B5C59